MNPDREPRTVNPMRLHLNENTAGCSPAVFDTLSRLGVERVPAAGLPFDPGVHEAIQHLETADFAPGVVAFEVQAGYRQGERLIRPALVVVAKAPQPVEDPGEPTAPAIVG